MDIEKKSIEFLFRLQQIIQLRLLLALTPVSFYLTQLARINSNNTPITAKTAKDYAPVHRPLCKRRSPET